MKSLVIILKNFGINFFILNERLFINQGIELDITDLNPTQLFETIGK